ncbi:fluoride efflux transporter CrcB [Azohydromonas caseinilytica]|uniref:Fluoride-specific ion channel FluC n=1 Tax=Azohydromonas caseinilytica TaxID=2728836 RepID=A0A848F5L9_9BURK|nr:fluoride efflux transporter CrcB [Azohydromonas caseinilytica]NML15357.1 fluoride efflux transporter CrcB [Azohydromonas caseinilytica]
MQPPVIAPPQVLAVALGAGAGAVLRWLAALWLNGAWAGFALGTLLVNCLGGLLIGVSLEVFARAPNELLRLLLVTGFLGGFTTFSAFSAESLSLLQAGRWPMALAHSFAHVAGALACCALGHGLARLLWVRG